MTNGGELNCKTQPGGRVLTPEDFGLGQLFWAIRDAVVVGNAETGRIVLWNPAAEELFGIPMHEAVGQPLEMLVPEPLRERHRAGLVRFWETGSGALLDAGQPVELPALRASGERLTIELTLSPVAANAAPGRFVLAIIRDATTRKQAEAERLRRAREQATRTAVVQGETALRQSEERFRNAFSQAAMGMGLVDLDGRFLQVNAALSALTGYPESELLTKTFQDITHPDDFAANRAHVDQLLSGKIRTYQTEKRFRRKDGEVVWTRLSASLVRDEHGAPAHFIVQVEDSTARKRAEEALRASEARYRALVERVPVVVYQLEVGEQDVPDYFSSYIESITGETPEEAAAFRGSWLERIHPQDRARAAAEEARAGAAGDVFRVEYRRRRKDGSYIWVWDEAVPLLDGAGQVCAWHGILRDISERMRLEEELRASASRYRTLIEQLPAVVYIQAADELRTPLYFSPSIQTLTGETPEEVLAFGENWLELVHPEDRARVAAEEARTAGLGTIFQVEYRRRRRDGSYVWVHDECAPFRDDAGQIIAWQGVMLDISERMRAEVAETESRVREEQRDQIRIILDHLPAGVLILSGPDAHVEQANTAATQMIFGPAAAPGMLPVLGRDFRWLGGDGKPPTHGQCPDVRALRGEVVGHEQLLLERQDGRRVPVLVRAALLPDATGQNPRAVLVLQDVTRLREAEQLKDDFLSLVSHEFRTPLTSIHGGAYLLLMQGQALDDQTRHELLSDIVTESDRLDHMLANMLTLTAVMAGRLNVSTEPVLLRSLAGQVATAMAKRVPYHVLRIDIPANLPSAEADPAVLAQVLRNLYENAAKYSPSGSEILTTASSDGESVMIEVTDSGMGIAPEQLERVFARFHRVDKDSAVRGTGLGLYLSRHLVEAQGGRLVCRSPGLGQGSTFAMTLPIASGWTSAE